MICAPKYFGSSTSFSSRYDSWRRVCWMIGHRCPVAQNQTEYRNQQNHFENRFTTNPFGDGPMKAISLLFVIAISMLLVGCSKKPSGPSYAEAVATYQAEVALLDSLQAKVDALIAKHGAARAAIKEKYAKMLSDGQSMIDNIELTGRGASSLERIESQQAELRKVQSIEFNTAQRAFDRESAPIVAELAQQKKRAATARSIRDALSK